MNDSMMDDDYWTVHVPTHHVAPDRREVCLESPLHLKFMDLTALMEVSSAKRLDALVTIVMDITALRWALFEILGVQTVMLSLH